MGGWDGLWVMVVAGFVGYIMVGGWPTLVSFFLFFLLLQFVDISGQWSVRVVVGLCGSSGGFGGW